MVWRRRSDLALREKRRPPGRPPAVRLEHMRRFCTLVAAGMTSKGAAIGACVPTGRDALVPGGERYATNQVHRVGEVFVRASFITCRAGEIAVLHAKDLGVREIGRPPRRAE